MIKNTIKIFFVTAIFAALIVFAPSCRYENEQILLTTKNASCDSTSVKFSTTILPLIVEHCQGGACHSAGNSQGTWVITTYAQVMDLMVDPTTNYLLGPIKRQRGFSQMPKNRSKLDACTIAKFENWVKEGARNN